MQENTERSPMMPRKYDMILSHRSDQVDNRKEGRPNTTSDRTDSVQMCGNHTLIQSVTPPSYGHTEK
jgi:hypothetical protein